MASESVVLLFVVLSIAGMSDPSTSAVDKYVSHLRDYSLQDVSTNNGINSTSTSNPLHPNSAEEWFYLYVQNKRIKRTKRENLCDSLCECQKDAYKRFMQVFCELNEKGAEQTFGEQYEIPGMATSLIVMLAPRSILRIEEGFFFNNRVGRLYIEGSPNNGEQLEIGTSAFKGNSKTPYPNIEIANIYSVIIREKAFRGQFKLTIKNCNDVIIFSNAFYNTTFDGEFHNILDLRMQKQSFISSTAKVEITSSNIDTLYRFDALIREIRFYNCTIGIVSSGTFDVLNINSIVFHHCKIAVFKSRAITEKLLSSHLAITEAVIGTIESEAIAGSGITEVIISRNEIDTIRENAIFVTSVKVTITHNRIKHLGNEWFRVKDWSNVTISDNIFGDFGSFTLDRSVKHVNCSFAKNLITNPKPKSLNISNPYCHFREVSFYKRCSCNTTWLEELSSMDLRSESYCTVDDRLKFCFNTTVFNVLKYKNEVCDYSKTKLNCLKSVKLKKVVGEFMRPDELESYTKQMKLVYILVGIAILTVIVTIVFVLAIRLIRRKNVTGSVSNTSGSSVNGTTLKDLKTFSIDDRRIINQTLTTMKQKYSPDIFEQVYNNTKKLLRGNITEMERVQTIGEIVQILGECQNPGDDFVAFTDIFYRHLAPTGVTTCDPVYAEPNLPENDIHQDNTRPIETTTTMDHIYAEPFSVQQPLLTNEYASPADRNDLLDLYSEPVTNEKDQNIIPPYAVIKTKEHPPENAPSEQASTSKNLPDVLNESKPLTNVQRIAQTFANNPNFSITKSPLTKRKIPKYSVPNRKRVDNSPDNENLGAAGKSGHSSTDTISDHSGGSDVTIKVDDIIEYADA